MIVSNEFGIMIWLHVAMVAVPALIALAFIGIPSDLEEKQIFLDPTFDEHAHEEVAHPRVA